MGRRKQQIKMTIAVDFDNTLFNTLYPEIISPREEIINIIKHLKNQGHNIILNTCRCGQYLEDALKVCHEYGLEFDAVNENLISAVEFYNIDCRKISADIYIDDHAFNPNSPTFIEDIENKITESH